MFITSLLLHSDTQSYGVAAIFGLIKDLKLYRVTSDFHLDLNKYQFSTSVANLGSMFVRARLELSPKKLTISQGTIPSPHRRPIPSARKIRLWNGAIFWATCTLVHRLQRLCRHCSIKVCENFDFGICLV
jgi:hypothetical protein